MRLTWGFFPYAIGLMLVTVAVVDGAISWKAPHVLTFRAVAPGEYLADTPLTEPGQWEIDLTASIGGKQIHAAHRLRVQ